MCLYVKTDVKTAKKDIKVYKLLFNGGLSIVYSYKYEVGVMPPSVNLVIENRRVDPGYHAYTSIKAAINSIFEYNYIAEFIIPKGSSYVIGKDGDIAASRMYMTDSKHVAREDISRILK